MSKSKFQILNSKITKEIKKAKPIKCNDCGAKLKLRENNDCCEKPICVDCHSHVTTGTLFGTDKFNDDEEDDW